MCVAEQNSLFSEASSLIKPQLDTNNTELHYSQPSPHPHPHLFDSLNFKITLQLYPPSKRAV